MPYFPFLGATLSHDGPMTSCQWDPLRPALVRIKTSYGAFSFFQDFFFFFFSVNEFIFPFYSFLCLVIILFFIFPWANLFDFRKWFSDWLLQYSPQSVKDLSSKSGASRLRSCADNSTNETAFSTNGMQIFTVIFYGAVYGLFFCFFLSINQTQKMRDKK